MTQERFKGLGMQHPYKTLEAHFALLEYAKAEEHFQHERLDCKHCGHEIYAAGLNEWYCTPHWNCQLGLIEQRRAALKLCGEVA